MKPTHALAPAGLARMSHVSISVADLDRTRRFYEDVFGFQTVIDRTLEGPEFEKITGVSGARSRMIRGLVAGNSVIQLFWNSWRDPGVFGGLISFEVRDIQAAYAALQKAGIACVSAPVEFDNSWAFVTRDPAGTSIEIIQWKAEADPYRSTQIE